MKEYPVPSSTSSATKSLPGLDLDVLWSGMQGSANSTNVQRPLNYDQRPIERTVYSPNRSNQPSLNTDKATKAAERIKPDSLAAHFNRDFLALLEKGFYELAAGSVARIDRNIFNLNMALYAERQIVRSIAMLADELRYNKSKDPLLEFTPSRKMMQYYVMAYLLPHLPVRAIDKPRATVLLIEVLENYLRSKQRIKGRWGELRIKDGNFIFALKKRVVTDADRSGRAIATVFKDRRRDKNNPHI